MAACEEAPRTFAETVGFIRRETEREGGKRKGGREKGGEREGGRKREGEGGEGGRGRGRERQRRAGSCSSHVSDVLFSFL